MLGSVMSAIGSFRWFLPGVAEEIKTFGVEAMDTVLRTGDTGYPGRRALLPDVSVVAP